MIITIGEDRLNELVIKQLNNTFLLGKEEEISLISTIAATLLKITKCFKENNCKYYWNDIGESLFNPYHSGQYSIFLFFLAQEVWKSGNILLADRIYYLNKMLNCLDLYYEVALPDIFYLDHPLGSVMGRASYSDYFVFQQNCTVGNNHGHFPVFGKFVWLFANSTIIGNTIIGNNVFVSTGTLIKDEEIPDNSVVFGKSPNLVIKNKPPEYFYSVSPFRAHRES